MLMLLMTFSVYELLSPRRKPAFEISLIATRASVTLVATACFDSCFNNLLLILHTLQQIYNMLILIFLLTTFSFVRISH